MMHGWQRKPLRGDAVVAIHSIPTVNDCSISSFHAAGGHALQRAQVLELWLLTTAKIYSPNQ